MSNIHEALREVVTAINYTRLQEDQAISVTQEWLEMIASALEEARTLLEEQKGVAKYWWFK